jgi:hypothetical protein
MKLRKAKKLRLVSFEEWAGLVLYEVIELRREVNLAMATQAEQVAILQQQQSEIITLLSVVGQDVQTALDLQQALKDQLTALNGVVPQDLGPLIDTNQQVLDTLGGIKNRLEASPAVPTDTTAPTS